MTMAAAQTLQQAPPSKMYSVLHQLHHAGQQQQQQQQQHHHNIHLHQQQQQQQQQQQTAVIVSARSLQARRPLAPAPDKTTSVLSANNNGVGSSDVVRCKRKISFVAYGGGAVQPASVARRNARERNRVKQVNNGFATLRQHIPASVAAALTPPAAVSPTAATSPGGARGASKKLSKVETLRMAVEYIRSLQRMLDEYDATVADAAGSTDGGVSEAVSRYFHQHTTSVADVSVSPTPSFGSEGSVSAVSGSSSSYAQAALYHSENYENYEPTSPEDEELLDVISWWQRQ